MKNSDDIQLKNDLFSSRGWKIIGVLPVAAFLFLIGFLYMRESSAAYESPNLLAILNTVFLCAISLEVAYLAARSYCATRVSAFLMIGCGLVFFGISNFYAGWVMPLAGRPNPTVTFRVEYEMMIEERSLWFSTAISPLDENCTVWVAHDITNRKKMEESLQKSEFGLIEAREQ
jgi:uncharacterized membrane protein